tara:strand:- start:6616 stop:7356 length:741 start_codon:yes stop_codon:yes gene_type:complete
MKDNVYSKMQKRVYNEMVDQLTTEEEREIIVWDEKKGKDGTAGDIEGLNNFFEDCDFLFSRINDTRNKIALDFGCGPGRNIALYSDVFERIDGVDICDKNINFCRKVSKKRNLKSVFYDCNGYDLSNIENKTYDVVMSFITLQHICVHEIRFNYFKEFNRVLKKGGLIEIQMGFGNSKTKNPVGYYENCYDADGTNGHSDTLIEDPNFLMHDLEKAGFENLKYKIVEPYGFGTYDDKFIFASGFKK